MLLHGAAAVLMLQICAWSARALSRDSGDGRGGEMGRATGEWGEWSAWTSCSADCGAGITARTRRCQHPVMLPVQSLLSRGDDSVWCEGQEKEMKLCNKQPCTDGRLGFREEECAKYKSSVYSLQGYSWEPFIHPSDPCRSSCRAKGHHFYANLAERVVDGTPCVEPTADNIAICVQGVCEEVGCDDIVGSPWRRDACGVCKGDNSTCQGISGIFTRLDLSRGAHKIVTIPLGATLVNISELRPSLNYLALQSPEGEFLLNDDITRGSSGDYRVAGTVFSYTKGTVQCPGNCLFARGPTNAPVNLMIVALGRNRGVMYSFNVPLDVDDDYFRQIITGTHSYSSMEEMSTTAFNRKSDASSRDSIEDSDSQYSKSEGFSETGDNFDDDEEMTAEYKHSSDNGLHSYTNNPDDFSEDEEDDYELYDFDEDADNGEDEEDDKESHSLSIPAYSVVDPNEMGKGSIFDESGGSTQTGYSDASAVFATNDHTTEHGVSDTSVPASPTNAGYGFDKTTQAGGGMKIIRKEKPKFVDVDDAVIGVDKHRIFKTAALETGDDSQTTSAAVDDTTTDTEHGPSPSAHSPNTESQHWTPAPLLTQHHAQQPKKEQDKSEEHENNTEERQGTSRENTSFEGEKHQNDGPNGVHEAEKEADDTQTSEPAHLLRPQSDSPTYGPYSQREASRYNRRQEDSGYANRHYAAYRSRFRRPNYSQSFTFRHRYNQYRGQTGDDTGSGYHRRRLSRPAVPPEARGSPQSSDHSRQDSQQERQIRFRQPPTRADPQSTQASPAGYETDRRDEYLRRLQSQRQALTSGQSATREQQNRQQSQARLNQSNARTQAEHEYNRRQEEYRREIMRRRQLYEQQRAAQEAEYQKRLQEHNRRLRERQMEMQRQQQQQHAARQQHEHRHRHQNHHQHQRTRPDHSQQQERQHQYLTNQQRRTYPQRPQISAPTGGIVSRIDTSVDRRQPSYPSQTDTTTKKEQAGSAELSRAEAQESRADQLEAERRRQLILQQQRGQATEQGRESSAGQLEAERRRQWILQQQRGQGIELGRESGGRDIDPRRQTQGTDIDISGDTTTMQATEPGSRSGSHRTTTPKFSRGSQPLTPTPPPTRDFLTIPEQPRGPTLSSRTPSGTPQYIPDSRFEDRSSLTAALSNQLEDAFEGGQRTDVDINLIPNVIDRQPVLSGGDVTSNVIEEESTYEWRVSGLTECTLTCGAGVQQTVVVCLDTRTQAFVTDENCARSQRPEPKAVTCNTRPCPAEWQTGEWTTCTAECGPGEQRRSVRCGARVSATLNVTMPDENCRSAPRPESRRACEIRACSSWIIGNWSQCSVQCGEGVRTRSVRCADRNGNDIDHRHCTEPKPDQEQPCEMGPCGKGWYYTEWPEQCPAQCGSGIKKRHVACLGEEGAALPDSRCDKFSRPTPEQPCRADVPCGGEWFASEWEPCNVTCGSGMKQREVVCMKALPGGLLTVVEDENCAEELKPITEEPCEMPACAAEWYMTSWSECSQTCGTGYRTREVKCLDAQQQPSADCDQAAKPRPREPCNTDRCTTPDPRPVATSITSPSTPPRAPDSECTDTFTRCEIVKHARMCRYEYYRNKCCATCNGDT